MIMKRFELSTYISGASNERIKPHLKPHLHFYIMIPSTLTKNPRVRSNSLNSVHVSTAYVLCRLIASALIPDVCHSYPYPHPQSLLADASNSTCVGKGIGLYIHNSFTPGELIPGAAIGDPLILF